MRASCRGRHAMDLHEPSGWVDRLPKMVLASHFVGKRLPDNTSPMNHINLLPLLVRLWRDRRGQDLVEYALMAGFVALAAGAIMPNVATSISSIFSEIGSVMTIAANQGS